MTVEGEEVPPWTEFYTEDDLQSALKIFTLYADNETYRRHARAHPDIAKLFELARRSMLPSGEDMKQRRKQRKQEKRDKDKQILAVAGIRQMRKVKMVGYTGGSVDLPMPPRRGTPDANESFAADDEQRRQAEASELAQQARTANSMPNGNLEMPQPPAESQPPLSDRRLTYSRSCHICGKPFRELHHFYDQLCPSCADYNYMKRFSEADMRGRVCIVTGARVKIGYCIALKLLRMGASVIVTTRFPHDAAARYAKEPDFESFAGRLAVYGLDFRDVPLLHHFCRHIRERYQRLDVIINNAAQTVRRPPKYYEHLIVGEASAVAPDIQKVIDVVDVHRAPNGGFHFGRDSGPPLLLSETTDVEGSCDGLDGELGLALPARRATVSQQEVNLSAALSQLALVDDDRSGRMHEFPPGLYDRDDQQVDMRRENSWTQELGEICTVEMMECHVINTFAPWILISELKPLMERSGKVDGTDGPSDKYVVNVSAMEGQFYRNKTVYHPHTNMAKAALNMLTRTASASLAAIDIYMTAVDTGWITDENPADQWYKREHAPPPLDEWDAAMRVLDPVLVGVRGEDRLWGVFLKNYFPTRW